MKAHARSLRIAPKKANIVAGMVRGMPVPKAMDMLQRTHKKAARMIEQLLKSAVANAEHNDRQEAPQLVIRSIIVNQGTSYRRGVPMARGRTRPMRKFLSHISITLGVVEQEAVGPDGSRTSRKSMSSRSSTKKGNVMMTTSSKVAGEVQSHRSGQRKQRAASSTSSFSS